MKIDIKGCWSKLKSEFRRRVLERHYRIVEFSKPGSGAYTKWWSIQYLYITGWKEVDIAWSYEGAKATLNMRMNEFVAPKQTVLKEI